MSFIFVDLTFLFTVVIIQTRLFLNLILNVPSRFSVYSCNVHKNVQCAIQ